jgi:hypothetical protein
MHNKYDYMPCNKCKGKLYYTHPKRVLVSDLTLDKADNVWGPIKHAASGTTDILNLCKHS